MFTERHTESSPYPRGHVYRLDYPHDWVHDPESWIKQDYNFCASLIGTPMPIPEGLSDRLLQEAVAKAKTAAWDIWTFMEEADKTHELVSKAHRRAFSRAYDIATARGPGRAVKTAAQFASAWMEYRYGWRVLMYDLEGAQDAVRRLQEEKIRLDRFTSHESIEDRVDWEPAQSFQIPTGYAGISELVPDLNRWRTRRLDVRAGAGVLQLGNFPFTVNPLLTGWELVPFSFIVDWFVDVGSVIAAHTPSFGRRLEYMWISTKQVNTITSTVSWQPRPSTHPWVQYLGNTGFSRDSHTQTIYKRWPVAKVPFSLDFNPQLDLSKFTDLASLVLLKNQRLFRRWARV